MVGGNREYRSRVLPSSCGVGSSATFTCQKMYAKAEVQFSCVIRRIYFSDKEKQGWMGSLSGSQEHFRRRRLGFEPHLPLYFGAKYLIF